MDQEEEEEEVNAKKRKLEEPAEGAVAEDNDSKPCAKLSSLEQQQENKKQAWQAVLERFPRCSAVEGLRETSYYFRNKQQHPRTFQYSSSNTGGCLKKLLQELATLEDSLPTDPAIWLMFDEETPQYMRALITAPTGTPYALGLFCFDLYIPDNYPSVPPKVQLLTTGGGKLRFSPNLYENGTVCLSLLGTWTGPRWNPLHSSILQVLVSIQGLILGVEHPYYLEPGNGGWEGGVMQGTGALVPSHVKSHEDKYREGTVKYAMLEPCRVVTIPSSSHPYLTFFRQVMAAHFAHYHDEILEEVRSWVTSLHRKTLKHQLEQAVTQLEMELGKLEQTKKAPKEAPTAAQNGGSTDEIVVKRRAMNEAASKGDFITAGRLQSELQYLERRGVETMIDSKRREMEQAAGRGDYITAGSLQQRVQYLEQHKKWLQDLQRRMFEAAAQQEFVRAGRFQEQHRILLDDKNESNGASGTTSTTNTSATLWSQGPAHALGLLMGAATPKFGPDSFADVVGPGAPPDMGPDADYEDEYGPPVPDGPWEYEGDY